MYCSRVFWALFAVLALSSSGCLPPNEESGETPEPVVVENVKPEGSNFIHMVYFWLKSGTTAEQKQSLMNDCRELLGTISTVRDLVVGQPAGTPRDVVDNSYSVGLVVYFDDSVGHNFYQTAEKHLEFISRNQDIWERVQVYDLLFP